MFRAFLVLIELDDDNRNREVTTLFQNLQSLVSTHKITRALVPYQGLHQVEMTHHFPQFLVFRVSRFQVFPWVVRCRTNFFNWDFTDNHKSPLSIVSVEPEVASEFSP